MRLVTPLPSPRGRDWIHTHCRIQETGRPVLASAQQTEARRRSRRGRRAEEALRLSRLARRTHARQREREAEVEALEAEARKLLDAIEPWQPVGDKRRAWAIEDRAAAAEREAAALLAEAIDHYSKALGYDADCRAAHDGLAELYWGRAKKAEGERQGPEQVYFEALVRDHDRGSYAALMDASAHIELEVQPAEAQVTLHRFEEELRRLVPNAGRRFEPGAISAEVAAGSYVAVVRHRGYAVARYPIGVGRGERHRGRLRLLPESMVGEGYVHVPAGPFVARGPGRVSFGRGTDRASWPPPDPTSAPRAMTISH